MPRITSELDLADLAVFGENVRAERLLRRWSIERLAKLANLAVDTVFRIEKGQPSTKRTRLQLCKALQSSYQRMLMKPRAAGKNYATHRRQDDWWMVHWRNRAYRHGEDEEDRIQVAEERVRLGNLGFVSHFVKMLNCRLGKGKLVSGILELYGEGLKSRYLGGEVFVYALVGSSRVVFDEEEFTLQEGEAATIQCSESEFYFAPVEGKGGLPPTLLYVRLDVGPEGAGPLDEELTKLVDEWEADPT